MKTSTTTQTASHRPALNLAMRRELALKAIGATIDEVLDFVATEKDEDRRKHDSILRSMMSSRLVEVALTTALRMADNAKVESAVYLAHCALETVLHHMILERLLLQKGKGHYRLPARSKWCCRYDCECASSPSIEELIYDEFVDYFDRSERAQAERDEQQPQERDAMQHPEQEQAEATR